MTLQKLMSDSALMGIENDRIQSEKSKKYLNITRDTGEFLSILVQATRASKILEIGTSNGYSTLWLASVLPSCGRIYTVEVNPQKISEARLNFEKAGVSAKIIQLAGDVSEVLEHLPERVDFIFLDADRKAYLSLAELLFNTLEPGLLVCDNAISHRDELADFTLWLNKQNNLKSALVPVGKGELLVYKVEVEVN